MGMITVSRMVWDGLLHQMQVMGIAQGPQLPTQQQQSSLQASIPCWTDLYQESNQPSLVCFIRLQLSI
eukprot:458347-Ditylum_brightwellii.AAC.1